MSSDDVFDQVDALIASDERQAIPEIADTFLRAIAKVPGAEPLVNIVRRESQRQRDTGGAVFFAYTFEQSPS